MTKFEDLALNALRMAASAAKKPGQDARFIEQASLQAAAAYAILGLNGKLNEVLTELRDLKTKE